MFDPVRARGAGGAGMVGGLLWGAIPVALAASVGAYVAVLASLALLLGVAGFYGWFRESLGLAGGVGTTLLGVGLSVVMVAAAADVAGLGGLAVSVGALAVAVLAVGSAALAIDSYRGAVVPAPTALALGVAIPLSALVNNTLVGLFGVGLGIYGLVWVLLGYHVFAAATESMVGGEAGSSPADA